MWPLCMIIPETLKTSQQTSVNLSVLIRIQTFPSPSYANVVHRVVNRNIACHQNNNNRWMNESIERKSFFHFEINIINQFVLMEILFVYNNFIYIYIHVKNKQSKRFIQQFYIISESKCVYKLILIVDIQRWSVACSDANFANRLG